MISSLKKNINKTRVELSKIKENHRKDGQIRINSVRNKLEKEIQEKEVKLQQLEAEKRNIPERIDVSTLENYGSKVCNYNIIIIYEEQMMVIF